MEPMDIVGKSKEDASLPKGFPLRSPLCVNLIEKLVCSYYIHIEFSGISLLFAQVYFVSPETAKNDNINCLKYV